MSVIGTSSFPDIPCPISEYSIVNICVFNLKQHKFCKDIFTLRLLYLHHHVLLLPIGNEHKSKEGGHSEVG